MREHTPIRELLRDLTRPGPERAAARAERRAEARARQYDGNEGSAERRMAALEAERRREGGGIAGWLGGNGP